MMKVFGSRKKGITRANGRVFVTLLLVFCVSGQIPLLAEESSLVMGVFPRKGFIRTLESFSPLADYLSEKLGRKVVLKSSRNFADFWLGVEQRQYDLVHFNQYHYVRSKKEFGYEVIAKNEEHYQSSMSGSLLVRKDSGINSLTDLRGKKILFGGGPRAMQSYIVASYLLQQAGLKSGDYQYTFAESPPNAIFAVYFQQVDAAGSADSNLELPVVNQRIDTSQIKVLARGDKLAHLPWAVKKDLHSSLKEKLQTLLVNTDESPTGKQILQRADLTDIIKAEDSDYDAHRQIIRQVLAEDY